MDSSNGKIFKLFYKTKKVLFSFNIKKILPRRKKTDNGIEQTDLDKKLVYSFSKSKLPSFKQIKYVKKYLNSREAWFIRISLIVIVVSIIFLGTRLYFTNLETVPMSGGGYVEGLVGNPKYINPLYSGFSDVDNDISSLVFSSLLRRGKDGQFINDLGESFEISEDNKIYTFKIRTDVKWHNNTPLVIDDIIYTFNIIKDSKYNSPLEKSFIGVELEKINEETLRFVLAEPYAAFLELLTFGILPQDSWYQIPPSSAGLAELNIKPIGSGPYKFKSLVKDKSGMIKSYNLSSNENYYGTPALIDNLTFIFYPNFKEATNALNEGLVDGISYLPKQLAENLVAKDSLNLHKLFLPQLTAIFFNNKNSDFLNSKEIRQALALSINKNEILENLLNSEARLIDGPILPDSFAYNQKNKKYNYNKEEAEKLLDGAGWKIVEITEDEITESLEPTLSDIEDDLGTGGEATESENIEEEEEADNSQNTISESEQAVQDEKNRVGAGNWRIKDDKFLIIKLSVVETDENIQIVEYIKKFWEDIGIKTEIEVVLASQIEIDVIKPRNFEALFYSQILGADPDLYVFWHSSQVGETGLNLSDYANKDVDQLLEDARISSNIEIRKEKYKKFQEIVTNDLPAIFLYSPTYTYVQSKKVKGFDIKSILTPKDRFSNITDWYIKTRKKLIWD